MRREGFIHPSAIIGEPPEDRNHRGKVFHPFIRTTATIEAGCTIDAGTTGPTRVGDDAWIMKGCHIGHDAWVGRGVELAPHCVIGGHVVVAAGAKLGMGTIVRPLLNIGEHAQTGCGSVVTKDIPPGEVWVGNPARYLRMRSEVHDSSPED